ncbi:hypothetical protein WS70_04490 [Burkholderia mayonis]|uniref:Uncharacterized protein n=1 Tax=Burkholderia mayonis TaxID=1385591 RepID=A0A1B4FBZ4_9BURK|nr:hypothetical protein WS70_04490 [Burkholderia mayonis]KVE49486.1 hypothetical protein WS70_20135 [Burkholderia mayonis]
MPAGVNLAILLDAWQRIRRAPTMHTRPPRMLTAGLFARLARPLFRFVSASRNMYPVGVPLGSVSIL